MNRQEKEQVIESLKTDFGKSSASFLVGYKGLTVFQMAELRKRLRKQGGSLHVAKITLIKRVVKDIPSVEPISSLLGDQTALVFVRDEPPAIAKILCDFSEECEKFRVIGGVCNSLLLTENTVKTFALLPSREVLLAQVCGTLKAPISKLGYILNMLLISPLLVLKGIEEQKKS